MSNKMCRIKNRGASLVVYKIPDDGIRRELKPGQTITVSYEELDKLMYQPGGEVILSQFLQILDTEALDVFGIKVEPEYHMTQQDIDILILKAPLDVFLDAIDYAPQGVIDMIKKRAIDVPMVDIQKRKAMKEKFGFDVEAALKHNEESKEEGQTTILKQTGERRVKVEEPAAPQGRRAAVPKYNIVSKAETAAE